MSNIEWISDREPTQDDLANCHCTWVTQRMRDWRGKEKTVVTFASGQFIRFAYRRWYQNMYVLAWMPKPRAWHPRMEDSDAASAVSMFENVSTGE